MIGWTEDQVRNAIAQPKSISGARWTFESAGEDLSVYFEDGKVKDVKPGDVPLKAVKQRQESPEIVDTTKSPRMKPPAGAVARCGDEMFVFVSLGDQTCVGHGGVAEWLEKPKPRHRQGSSGATFFPG